MEKTVQREQARELYFQTEMTQEQIAHLLNINRKTVGLWIQQGKWHDMKQSALQAPGMVLQQLYDQLTDLNIAISNRQLGHRYPTLEESAIQRRLMLSIKNFEHQPAGNYIQTYTELINEIAQGDPQLSREVCHYSDDIIRRKYNHDKKTSEQYMFLNDDIDELDNLDKELYEQSIVQSPPNSDIPNSDQIASSLLGGTEVGPNATPCDINETHITQQDQPSPPDSQPPTSQNNISEKCDNAIDDEKPKIFNGIILINSTTVYDPALNRNREIKMGELDEFLRLGYIKFLR